MNDTLRNTLTLCIIMVASGMILYMTDSVTSDVISMHMEDEYLQDIKDIFPDATDVKTDSNYSTVEAGGEVIGYVAIGSANGYQSRILMLVGVGPDKRIVGVKVYDVQDTPGIGTRIREDDFLGSFTGREDADVDAITGATISSTAAIEAVADALEVIP